MPLPRCAGSRFPSLAVFGLAWAGAAVCRSLARCGFPSLAVRRRLAARGGVFLRPGPAALARLAWPGRSRPPGGGRPTGSPCPRSPLILLETSQTFYKFKALAAAATPRPSSVWFGRGRRRLACVRRPPRLFVPAQVAAGVLRFLVSGARKKRKKAFCGKSVEKFQKIPKMSIIRPILCRKRKNV